MSKKACSLLALGLSVATACSLGDELRPSESCPSGKCDAPAPSRREHGALLWQGFHHEWQRSVLGFRIPHRISRFDSFVADEVHDDVDGWRWQGAFHLAQSTGVDGNFMAPVGFYSAVYHPELGVRRGALTLRFSDEVIGGDVPHADSRIEREITVPAGEGGVTLAVLRGVGLETSCDDARQPSELPCNSDGMWPYRFRVDIDACTRSEGDVTCPVVVEIARGWTPNRGGLANIAEKPLNRVLDFDLTVYYTVLSGSPDVISVTHARPALAETRARVEEPASTRAVIAGRRDPSYPVADVAITGTSFELFRIDDAEKFSHLGRYILGWGVEASLADYDAVTGRAAVEVAAQLLVPKTVADSGVRHGVGVALIQLGPGGEAAVPDAAAGSICINSSAEAPFFSHWKACGDDEHGPAREHDVVAIGG